MARAVRSVDWNGRPALRFECPACTAPGAIRSARHYACVVDVPGVQGPVWQWNGSLNNPTLSPSILVKSGPGRRNVCHSYIRDGRIEYLPDCTHSMAGRTIDLPEVSDP